MGKSEFMISDFRLLICDLRYHSYHNYHRYHSYQIAQSDHMYTTTTAQEKRYSAKPNSFSKALRSNATTLATKATLLLVISTTQAQVTAGMTHEKLSF